MRTTTCLLLVAFCLALASVGCNGSCSSDHQEMPPPDDAGACDGGSCTSIDGSAGSEDGGQDSGASLDGGRDASASDAASGDAASADAGDAALPCVPATEVCNGLDDDCDGISDEALLEMSADDSQRFELPESVTLADDQRGFAQLLRRGPDSAWLLHKPLGSLDAASGLEVSALDAAGDLIGSTQTGLLPTGRVFLGASLDDFVAVLWRDTDADGNTSVDDLADSKTHLTLFEAVGGVLTEQVSVELGGPADISELELQRGNQGNLRVLAVYAPWAIATGSATLTPTVLHSFRYAPGLEPALVEVSETTLPANARPTVHALPRPCDFGWIVAYWTNNGGGTQAERELFVRSMSMDGAIDFDVALFSLSGHALQGFASAPTCSGDSSPLLLLADATAAEPDGPRNLEAYELAFDHETASISEVDSLVLAANVAFTRSVRHGGEWYVTLRNFDDTPTGVFELDVIGQRVRDIATPIAQGGLAGAGLTTADVNLYFIPTQGIASLGDDLLVTFSNAKPETSPLGRETVAVTHRLSCP